MENGKKLDCYKGDRDEASIHDKHAIRVCKQEKYSTLVGYVPKENSTLVGNFSNADKEERLTAVVTGKQKR